MPADKDAKTEPATPRKKNEAREQGNVARSQDLTAASGLLAGLIALELFGPGIWDRMIAMMTDALTTQPESGETLLMQTLGMLGDSARMVAPLLILLVVVTLAALYAQVGWIVTAKPVTPNLGKLNPIKGFQRIFSGRAIATTFINMGKLAIVVAVTYLTVSGAAAEIFSSFKFDFRVTFALGAALMFRLGIRLAIVLLILALIDFSYQKYRHAKDLKMTKEEVKDEMRSMEGNPEIRRRRRQLQLQLSLQRVRAEVPQADVVVTNPTHFALAIRYDAPRMNAPIVVAKGMDLVALRIRQIAAEHGVPIVQRPALARAMYEAVDVGKAIPERFYQAIAEILAYVYEINGNVPGVRKTG